MKSHGYAAHDKSSPLVPYSFDRRDPGPEDVVVEIAYCGICHSDIHQARDEWGNSIYPMVPGHEIVGRVSAVGEHVTKHKVGDLVGVGCMVDSCQHCADCEEGLENYCDGMVGTYNGPTQDAPGHTLGGYSQQVVVHERFVLNVKHDEAQLAAVAPLLCAGITTWSPLRHWNAGPGKRVGIVGIGGLAMQHAARTEHFFKFGILGVIRQFRFFFGIQMVEVAKKLIEAVYGRQKFVAVAEMVLAKLTRRVPLRFE